LVKALDRPEALANNPMQALFEFHEQVPPARGALWFAAGVRGTSFEIVNITAVLYVALDSGVDVGLLGVARMALPADDFAIVSIELVLKARFSTSEGLFSVQAQLTDNSWLITRDCQLTGGFAFFMWFRKSQFLLTIGGYHPSFQPLPEYPVVPRVGYRWNFLGVVQIMGSIPAEPPNHADRPAPCQPDQPRDDTRGTAPRQIPISVALGPAPRLDPITRFLPPIDPWVQSGFGWGDVATGERGEPLCSTNHPAATDCDPAGPRPFLHAGFDARYAAPEAGGVGRAADHRSKALDHLLGPRQLQLREVRVRECPVAHLRQIFRRVDERQLVPARGLRRDEFDRRGAGALKGLSSA